jgi:type VI secretion system protein VasJ
LAQQVLMEGFWEAMYPPLRRMRARQGALQFMAERLTQETQNATPGPGDDEVIGHAIEVIKNLQGFTMEAMGEEAPVLSGLRKALEDAQRKAPRSEPVEAPAEEAHPAAPAQAADDAEESTLDQAEAPAPEQVGHEEAQGSLVEALQQNPTPLLIDVKRPIPGENPAGEDISYNDDFQEVKDQIDQISSVNPEGVDFEDIVEKCQMLLGQKAKDLRVSTYLALALARTEGYRGIAEGLLAQQVLMEGFWEAMYPPLRRMRARQGALQFMAERLSQETQTMTPTLADTEAIAGALDVVKQVQDFTMEAMGEDAPVLSGLRKALEDAQRKIPKPAAPAPPKPAATPKPETTVQAQGASVATSAPSSTAPALAAPETATEAVGAVLKMSRFIREQDPTNPIAYRLARIALWDPLLAEPANEKGKTLFADLAPHRLQYLNTLVEEANWDTLLTVAENTYGEAPYHFLLDLQRFVVMAMNGLGESYQAAKEAVLLETAVLLKRLPALLRFTFIDGLNFADPATQFWVEDVVAPVLASGGGGTDAGEDKALADQYEQAKKLAAEGKLSEALGVLQAGARQDGSRRSRFFRRFYMAQLCLQGNQPLVACSLLEELDREMERVALATWDAGVALDVWTHLHRSYEMLKGREDIPQESLGERARQVFAKICQVDVTRALKDSTS